MEDQRNYREYIEGEFEVLDERDASSYYEDPIGRRPIEIDTRKPYITYVMIGLIGGVWLIISLLALYFSGFRMGRFFVSAYNVLLLLSGAKVNELVSQGQYWRLFTAMFLHANIIHLFFNAYAIRVYGPIVEQLFGKLKFVLIYLISGLTGSIFSYLFSSGWAVGASGAIFGLMGALLYFRQQRQDIFNRVFGSSLIAIIVINLIYGFVSPGIDNWGHIGGLVGGYLMGNAVGLYKDNRLDRKNIIYYSIIALIFIVGIIIGKIFW